MRSVADGARLRQFLTALAGRLDSPGTVYLVGGSSAVWEGWRPTTIDIDLKADPEPGGFFEAIAFLKDEIGINVEMAAPDQFIPPLPGWQERSPLVNKTGLLTVRHYDFYSQALAKILRGHARDLTDARAMAERQLIDKTRLEALFLQIEPRLVRYPGIEPVRFRREVLAFCQP
jgi:hypothetical protein